MRFVGKRIDMLDFFLKNKDNNIKYELREYKEQRSLNANAYFHVLCNELAKVLGKSN